MKFAPGTNGSDGAFGFGVAVAAGFGVLVAGTGVKVAVGLAGLPGVGDFVGVLVGNGGGVGLPP
ncbi:MAG: hypothetical protein WBO97_10160, partial [Tepidiformaceae bacterium]